LSSSALPTLSSRQVREVDSLCEERFGISTDWLMEAAGWQIARFVDRPAAVVCGVGNNAGDGLAAARHLHRWGLLAGVACVDPDRLHGAAARQLQTLLKLGVKVSSTFVAAGDAIVDAIFGTGLSRPPEGTFAEWIEVINDSKGHSTIISVDVPSGLDAESGFAYSPIVDADVTVTLGLPKPGLRGEVVVVDIGIPTEAYAALGIEIPEDARQLIRR
jgi:ADP-dependent NAD(P)H-hydrate dehydratase / NAD(P)H-hydrate epimerase